MNKRFAVKSGFFSLYEAFKKEVEKLGFNYKEQFTSFNEEEFTYHDCMFFCDKWDHDNDRLRFALSNAGSDILVFSLETEWKVAIEYAQRYAEHFIPPIKKKVEISLSKLAEQHGIEASDIVIIA